MDLRYFRVRGRSKHVHIERTTEASTTHIAAVCGAIGYPDAYVQPKGFSDTDLCRRCVSVISEMDHVDEVPILHGQVWDHEDGRTFQVVTVESVSVDHPEGKVHVDVIVVTDRWQRRKVAMSPRTLRAKATLRR